MKAKMETKTVDPIKWITNMQNSITKTIQVSKPLVEQYEILKNYKPKIIKEDLSPEIHYLKNGVYQGKLNSMFEPNGKGIIVYIDNSTYEGHFHNGLHHGGKGLLSSV